MKCPMCWDKQVLSDPPVLEDIDGGKTSIRVCISCAKAIRRVVAYLAGMYGLQLVQEQYSDGSPVGEAKRGGEEVEGTQPKQQSNERPKKGKESPGGDPTPF